MPTNKTLVDAINKLNLTAGKIDAIGDAMVVGTDLEQSSIQSFGCMLADLASEVIATTEQLVEDR